MHEVPRQAAAIPFRQRDGKTEVCLITTSSGASWTVPKGVIEQGNTGRDTALTEAREEAGLHGDIIGGSVDHYTLRKWDTRFTVEVYVMKVTQEDDEWEEKSFRQRRWSSGVDAVALIGNRSLGDVLRQAMQRLEEQGGTLAAPGQV